MNPKTLKALLAKLRFPNLTLVATATKHHPLTTKYLSSDSSTKATHDEKWETALLQNPDTPPTTDSNEPDYPPNYAKVILDAFCSGKPVSCVCLPIKADKLRDHLAQTYPTQTEMQFRADDIQYVTHLLEGISLCETCLGEQSDMAQLIKLSGATIERYRQFYQALHQTGFVSRCQTPHADEVPIETHFFFAIAQMERIAASVSRILEAACEMPVFDQDAWYIVSNQVERLMKATMTLQDRVEQVAQS
ncbi:uncharacterized protein BP01DRAFT_370027 [Aspergillus saccharolyticus JOP 1030-1]|uniref:Uncharacterized protein n=1 Tax=Aspergillus saccharolyticus JOP 1030-1 TaxID=1450539 RepID=A0A318Z9T0_9EURO|nr:hypothetical protein BP01DRAFT_370027 [Aspergillus saccharolyticus JOP 1030-1]PYH40280.1 hypothetical protein BP01DRAFT_370027 [Aspergillus saccharolyticus JOP 1030-1]